MRTTTRPSEWLKQHTWIRYVEYQFDACGQIVGGCILGAIGATIHDWDERNTFINTLLNVIEEDSRYRPKVDASISEFNDTCCVNKDMALHMLENVERQLYGK